MPQSYDFIFKPAKVLYNFRNGKTSFKEVFEKSLAIPDYFHYLCN